MKDVEVCRLMLFALFAIGLALILVGAIVTTFAPYQADAWLSAEERGAANGQESAERVLRRMDQAIQLGLFILGGLVATFSMIGLWSYRRTAGPPVAAEGPEPKAGRPRNSRVPRLLAFGLMFFGLVLSLLGQSAEINSIRSAPTVFAGGPSWEGRSLQRKQADFLKNAGVVLVLAR